MSNGSCAAVATDALKATCLICLGNSLVAELHKILVLVYETI